MRKGICIGGDSFKKLMERHGYYVDKTRPIKRLLESGGEVILITRPRRFGKSLFLDMMKTFLNPDLENPGGVALQEKLFAGLEILKEKDFCIRVMGKVPVLHISFKGVGGDSDSFELAYADLTHRLSEAARAFKSLIASDKLSAEERLTLQRFTSDEYMRDLSHQSEVRLFISKMSQLLAGYFGHPVVLLMDEYDVPLAKASEGGYYKEMARFLRALLNPLKPGGEVLVNGLPALEKTLMTGCLRVSKESLFTGLNNLYVDTVCSVDSELATAIGFTEDEVKALLTYYGLESRFNDVKAWYDGYQFDSKDIYCPWDVLYFCNQAIHSDRPLQLPPGDYWSNTGEHGFIDDFLNAMTEKGAEQLQTLVEGGEISFRLNEQLTYGDLQSHRLNDFWTLLLSTGYLTLCGPVEGGPCRVRIPNQEVRKIFSDRIAQRYSEENKVFVTEGETLAKLALNGDAEGFEATLKRILRTYISVRDTATRAKAENFYHGFLLALLTSAGDEIDNLSSNREAGDGYADIMFTSENGRTGAVLELKHSAPMEIYDAADAALVQIRAKRYAEGFSSRRCKRVWCYGVAFSGKDCAVEAAEHVAA